MPELCDWCGLPFKDGETPVEGINKEPTHRKCARFIVTNPAAGSDWVRNQYLRDDREEREPFTDWPNGQGTYD